MSILAQKGMVRTKQLAVGSRDPASRITQDELSVCDKKADLTITLQELQSVLQERNAEKSKLLASSLEIQSNSKSIFRVE